MYVCRVQLSMATMDAAKGVVKHLFSKLTGSLEHHLEVLKASVSVFLCTLCKIDILVDRSVLELRVITDAFGTCQLALQDWVKQPNVIGGSLFGGRVRGTDIVCANREMQVFIHIDNAHHIQLASLQLWQSILTLQMPTESSRIANGWCQCVEKVIRKRVNQVASQNAI